jgi:UDP-N-acetylmuramoyl-tripeptide--D-alanyl-D-alanine ligase
MARCTAASVITYGTGQADIRATGTHLIGGAARFTLHTPSGSAPVVLRLLGAHQVHNALAAAAAAHALDMDASSIAAALSSAESHSPGRLQILQRPDGITIINDAFNANPESTAAGLRSLACYAGRRRTVAVLGEMRELGPAAEAAHRDTSRLAAEIGIDTLITVGHGLMDTLAEAARTNPAPPAIHAAEAPDDLLPLLRRLLQPRDVVFIKASRSVGLENFAATLQGEGPARPAD